MQVFFFLLLQSNLRNSIFRKQPTRQITAFIIRQLNESKRRCAAVDQGCAHKTRLNINHTRMTQRVQSFDFVQEQRFVFRFAQIEFFQHAQLTIVSGL